jgi:hypothetical protein
LTRNRRLGVRGGIELGKRRRVVPDGRLESRLSVSFIDELARVLGDVLEDADDCVVLLGILEESLVRIVSDRDELAKSPVERRIHGLNRLVDEIQLCFDVV